MEMTMLVQMESTHEGDAMKGVWAAWLKTNITGFDPNNHCAKAFRATHHRGLPTDKNAKKRHIAISLEEGSLGYFCIVSTPYVWGNNRHLAFEVGGPRSKERIAVETAKGDVVYFSGITPIEFNDRVARQRFAGLGEDFLTCRNFHFLAAMAAAGRIDQAPLKRHRKAAGA